VSSMISVRSENMSGEFGSRGVVMVSTSADMPCRLQYLQPHRPR
jgi:hypothetical protein